MKISVPRLSLTALVYSVAATSMFAADSAEVAAHSKSYTAAGEAVLAMVNSKKVDAEAVVKKTDTMIADGIWIAEEYLKLKPEASKWFKAVFEKIPEIKKMPYEEIEKNWHDGHHFDGKEKEIGINHQDEKNEHFRDPLDSVTHALLIQRSAKDFGAKQDEESLKRMKSDVAEGLEQFKKAVAVVAKK
ncbi:MAG: hypothetical protein WCL08_12905 [Verrucomicrobiota bacterium]